MLLGDYLGYGADPEWTVTTVMDLVEKGARAVLGNHDSAVSNPREQLNVEAKIAMEWTRGELGATERRFLGKLPLTLNDDDRLYVHAEASSPKSWRYVTSVDAAAKSIIATTAQITICGHVHRLGALQHVGNRENYGVHTQHGRDHPIARWTRTAVAAGGARLGGAAPRR